MVKITKKKKKKKYKKQKPQTQERHVKELSKKRNVKTFFKC